MDSIPDKPLRFLLKGAYARGSGEASFLAKHGSALHWPTPRFTSNMVSRKDCSFLSVYIVPAAPAPACRIAPVLTLGASASATR